MNQEEWESVWTFFPIKTDFFYIDFKSILKWFFFFDIYRGILAPKKYSYW